ncbi:hypothetical protein [Pseudarthrobacter cellobiosi]|uniref:hypothetical protein n=1 Tax=Pseudarthrobacter cellobiosi TaxID=2953654 RepID=UPI00208E3BBC|nr:hypothetical protein [Pseudarthrobacter sp. HLT1-5]MCO4257358.1 hypothetical protein [Pseudarthrobacter sp. HLT1-5]
MSLKCPRCNRRTFVPARVGNFRVRPTNLPAGVIAAITLDGTCTTCYRFLKGKTRLITKGTTSKEERVYRHTMSDAEIEQARQELQRLWAARRRRGVHPEGLDPATLHRPGLTLLEA